MLEQLNACIGLTKEIKGTFMTIYSQGLGDFLNQEKKADKTILPPEGSIFNAFNILPFEQYKVVIIGQDPYHGLNQANGLAFSVNKGQKIPPSLRNIYKELKSDLGLEIPQHGDLSNWAKQGVLLLNTVLTVEEGKPGSHQGKGWEHFTDAVITEINNELNGVVFLLWGNYAKSKKTLIDNHKHLILEANHPSPLSANRGFFLCKHFSKTNEYLKKQGKEPINWIIS
jgi:uracil-DNA glycosylase